MSEYSLRYHPSAVDEINELEESVKERVRKKLVRLKDESLEGKPLKGELKGFRSSRVGNYRIVFTISDHKEIIYVLYVGHRSKVYEEAKRKL